ncbi:calnexin homolog [Triticum aestivum]|uniref:calnexin homolog n=1 Tax=Triticum aestivum TaxID=4565 RepID=UPI001D0060EE|nr:calnexin homolog [Triticum aestivum]
MGGGVRRALVDLLSIVRASNRCRCQQQEARAEILLWGRRRPRKAPAAPPYEKPAADDDSSKGVASPDTTLAFPEDDEAAATEDEAKAGAQDKWPRWSYRPPRLPMSWDEEEDGEWEAPKIDNPNSPSVKRHLVVVNGRGR